MQVVSVTDRVCAIPSCGKPIPPEKRADAKYCSDECLRQGIVLGNKARRRRAHEAMHVICKGCGTDLGPPPAHRPPVYCAECKEKRAKGQPLPGTYATRVVPVVACHFCQTPTANLTGAERVICPRCKDPANRPPPKVEKKPCSRCGALFLPPEQPKGGHPYTRCEDCREKAPAPVAVVDAPSQAQTVREAFEAGWSSGKRSLSWLRDLLTLALEDFKKAPTAPHRELVDRIADAFDEALKTQAQKTQAALDVRLQEQVTEDVYRMLEALEPPPPPA